MSILTRCMLLFLCPLVLVACQQRRVQKAVSPDTAAASSQTEGSVDSSSLDASEEYTRYTIQKELDPKVRVDVSRAKGRVLLRFTAPTDFVAPFSSGFTTVLDLHEILVQHAPELADLPDSSLDVKIQGPIGGGRPVLEIRGGFQNLTAAKIKTQALWISKGRGTLDIRGQNLSYVALDSFLPQSKVLLEQNSLCRESQRIQLQASSQVRGLEQQNCQARPAWVDSITRVTQAIFSSDTLSKSAYPSSPVIAILDSSVMHHSPVSAPYATLQTAPQQLWNEVTHYTPCWENEDFCGPSLQAWFPSGFIDYDFVHWESANDFYRMKTNVFMWKNFSPLHTDHGVLNPNMSQKQVLALLDKPAYRKGKTYYWKTPGQCGEDPSPEIGLSLGFDEQNQLSWIYYMSGFCLFN